MRLCADFDLIVTVPHAAPAIQQRYLREHIRAHVIGRDPSLPALRVYVDDYYGSTSVPRGVDVVFASRRGPKPHKVKVVESDSRQPKVRCVYCDKAGIYVGAATSSELVWENGVKVEHEVVHVRETFYAANNVIWNN